MKTGSMVTAFVNAYYKETKVPVLAVSWQVKVVQLSVNGREMRIIYQMPSKDWKKQFCMQKRIK